MKCLLIYYINKFSVCFRILTMEWGAKENSIAVIALHKCAKAKMKYMSFSYLDAFFQTSTFHNKKKVVVAAWFEPVLL